MAEETNTTTNLNDGESLSIAHPEDFGIVRDDSGDISPVKQRIPGTDMAVRCKPLVGGAVERWDDVLDEDNADDERVDEFLQTYINEGVGSDGLDNCPDYLVPGLIEAVKNSSGYEVFQHLQRRQEEENMRVYEQMENLPDALVDQVMGKIGEEMPEDADRETLQPRTNGE